MKTSVSDIQEREVFPGYHGRLIHTDRMTLAYWRIDAGSPIPSHAHPHEQIVNMQEGQFELTVDGQAHLLRAGDVVVIPPGVSHAGIAVTDCRILDVWSPPRDDYR